MPFCPSGARRREVRYPSAMTNRRSISRQLGLAAIGFLATLAILLGTLAVISRAGPAGRPSPPVGSQVTIGSPRPSASPTDAGPSVSGDPVLVGAGDIADCGPTGDEATAPIVESIAGTVFTAGDNAYPDGSLDQYTRCYDPTWGQFKNRTRPAPGNHEYQTPKAAGYLAYFGAAATNAQGKTWYSYDLGSWHVIVLDSNCAFVGGCGPDSEQARWLGADLAASKALCSVAIWHHPRFSSGEHGDDPAMDPFWRALYTAGVDVVINGHDHDYERLAPQDPSGKADSVRGIREFVVGTGGTTLRKFRATAVANSELRTSLSPGVLKLTLHSTTYDWSFIPTSKAFSDSGSAPCH